MRFTIPFRTLFSCRGGLIAMLSFLTCASFAFGTAVITFSGGSASPNGVETNGSWTGTTQSPSTQTATATGPSSATIVYTPAPGENFVACGFIVTALAEYKTAGTKGNSAADGYNDPVVLGTDQATQLPDGISSGPTTYGSPHYLLMPAPTKNPDGTYTFTLSGFKPAATAVPELGGDSVGGTGGGGGAGAIVAQAVASVSIVVKPVDLVLSGTTMIGTTPSIIIGQAFGASVVGGLPPMPHIKDGQNLVDSYGWQSPAPNDASVPFFDYAPSKDFCSFTQFVEPPVTNASLSCYFGYLNAKGDPNQESVTCVYFSSAAESGVTLNASINVCTPTYVPDHYKVITNPMGSMTLGTLVVNGLNESFNPTNINPNGLLLYGATTSDGITQGAFIGFQVTDPPNFPGSGQGTFLFFQLVSSANSFPGSNPLDAPINLDTTYPYKFVRTYDGVQWGNSNNGVCPNGLEAVLQDAPSISVQGQGKILQSPSIESLNSQDWIGYTPSGGITVPIPISLWTASGTATLANGIWSATQGPDEAGPHGQPSTQFVTWTGTTPIISGNGESSIYGFANRPKKNSAKLSDPVRVAKLKKSDRHIVILKKGRS